MQVPDFTINQLKTLPLRATVAFAARCARRVEHLAQFPPSHPNHEGRRAAVEAALYSAESYASGTEARLDTSLLDRITASPGAPAEWSRSEHAAVAVAEAANAAFSAQSLSPSSRRPISRDEPLDLTPRTARSYLGSLDSVLADLATRSAFTAAVEAFTAIGCDNVDFVNAAWNDYEMLVRLGLGRYPEPGSPIDPSPNGPLGRL
jgi:hypothetical protein